jgi:hypothetical protein
VAASVNGETVQVPTAQEVAVSTLTLGLPAALRLRFVRVVVGRDNRGEDKAARGRVQRKACQSMLLAKVDLVGTNLNVNFEFKRDA